VDVKAMLLMHSDDKECERLRAAWKLESELKDPNTGGINKISEKGATKMQLATTGYLESRVETELDVLKEKRRQAAVDAAKKAADKVKDDTRTLRTALGEDFIRNANVLVQNAEARFVFKSKEYVLTNTKENGFKLNDQKLADAPGTVADRIVATLVLNEDF
jgi:hypothetical protein